MGKASWEKHVELLNNLYECVWDNLTGTKYCNTCSVRVEINRNGQRKCGHKE